MYKQLQDLLDAQQVRDLTPAERAWIMCNFPEYESLLVAE
jgi:hypothetical protein